MLLVIPTYNEEEGVVGVIEKAKRLNLDPVVVDGGSEDNTIGLVEKAGARLVNAPKGKGKAFRHLLENLDEIAAGEEHILMIDGDGTYDLNEFRMLERYKDYDMVVGRRVPVGSPFAFHRAVGNRLLNLVFFALFRQRTPDLLSGYRLIRVDKLRKIGLEYDGFELETELTAKFMRSAYSIMWVPVSYEKRQGKSKLKAFEDGYRILRCMVQVRFS